MNTSEAAIRVWVVRGSGSAASWHGDATIPVEDIVSYDAIEPPRGKNPRKERARVVLREPLVELESWVFRYDDDLPYEPREVYTWDMVQHIRGLIALAVKERRAVATEDLGNAVANKLRQGTAVPITPMKRLKLLGKKPPE